MASNPLPLLVEADSLAALRARIIDGMLRVLVVAGLIALPSGIWITVQTQGAEGQYGLMTALITCYVLAYAIVCIVTSVRRVPPRVKAGTSLAMFYGLGVLGLLEAGLVGDGRRVRQVCPQMRVVYMSGYTHGLLSASGALDESVVLIQKPFGRAALLRGVLWGLER